MSFASCIMPTANRRSFVPAAIRMFLAQDYPQKELLIIDDGADCIEDLVPAQPQIRYIRRQGPDLIGHKRNIACEIAHGDIIVHWDDDDWYAPWRLAYQVEALESGGLDICGVGSAFFVDAAMRRAWEYV